jgi:hypothetical protein
MCKRLTAAVVLIVIVAAGLAYRRFRILPLSSPRRPHVLEISKADIPGCRVELNVSPARAVILRAGPDLSSVTINEEKLSELEVPQRLSDILRTRADRMVYVVSEQDSGSTELTWVVKQVPEVDRICVIDPRHPPSWYPPTRETGPK